MDKENAYKQQIQPDRIYWSYGEQLRIRHYVLKHFSKTTSNGERRPTQTKNSTILLTYIQQDEAKAVQLPQSP